MSRLQKKCIIGSTSVHLALLLVLIIGPGFFSKDDTLDESQVLTFMPMMATDSDKTGGGTPRQNPQPPTPRVETPPPAQPPAPRVQERVEQPDPPKREETKEVEREKPTPQRNDRESLDAKQEKPKKHEVKVNTKVVKIATATRNQNSTSTAQEQKAQERAAAERAAIFRDARQRVSSNLSSTTQVDMPEGPGGGGVSYAPYAQIVRKVYTEAWSIPNDVTDDEATIKVSVTIRRDGSVISSRIIKESGSRLVDRSIQNALDRVTSIGVPFPAGAKESQRTFTINFSLKAKKLLG